MKLAAFNQLDTETRAEQLLACCHCRVWADRVAATAPFASAAALLEVAATVWAEATETDILEAFSGHPEIGDLSALRNRFAKTASAEQGQVTTASDEVLLKLKAGNEAYRDKFGFIFIVFGVWQLYRAFSNKKYENLETDILVSFNKIKFQVYKEYTKASLSFDSKTISNANGKFSILANYIFGGNKENQQISMTSPVLYNIKNESTFSFIMPSSYKKIPCHYQKIIPYFLIQNTINVSLLLNLVDL